MKNFLLLGLAALLALAQPALAQSPVAAQQAAAQANAEDVTNDVHCLIAVGWVMELPQPGARSAGVQAIFLYYEGRLALIPGLDLDGLARTEAPKLTGTLLAGEVRRCIAQMQTVAAGLKSIPLTQMPATAPPGQSPLLAADNADMRCLLAYAYTGKDDDAATSARLPRAAYYFGKVNDEMPDALAAHIKSVAATMTTQTVADDLPRCESESAPAVALTQSLGPRMDALVGGNPLLAMTAKSKQ